MRVAILKSFFLAGSVGTAAAEVFATDCKVSEMMQKATWTTVDERAFGGCRTGDRRNVLDDERMCAIQIVPTRPGLLLDVSETPGTSSKPVAPDDPQCVQTRDWHGCKIIGSRWVFPKEKTGPEEMTGTTNSSTLLPRALRLVVANANGVWITQQLSQKALIADPASKVISPESYPVGVTTKASASAISFGETYYVVRRRPYYIRETSSTNVTTVSEMIRLSFGLTCTINGKPAPLLTYEGETQTVKSESLLMVSSGPVPEVEQKSYEVLTFQVKPK